MDEMVLMMLPLLIWSVDYFQEYMADHDQQYLIELDANQTAATLFKVSVSFQSTIKIQNIGTDR